MEIIQTKTLSSVQSEQINSLWNSEYPLKLKDRFPILLEGTTWHNHYLIEDSNHVIIAWAVMFEHINQIRFSIIVSQDHQGKGLGKLLLDHLKSAHNEFYGWVIDHNTDLKSNGENYISPLPFYIKQGFEIIPNQRIESEMIQAVLVGWKKSNKLDSHNSLCATQHELSSKKNEKRLDSAIAKFK
jgi:GNAT superfamily N-acetyltransferase